MARPYSKLRGLMVANGDTQETLARLMHCTQAHISALMNNRSSWRLDDAYMILDRYGLPHGDLATVFPRGGRNE